MLSEDACRTHMRYQVDVLTFLSVVVVYIYDASWLRLVFTTVLRRLVVDHEITTEQRSVLQPRPQRRAVAAMLSLHAAVGVYQHCTSAQLNGTLEPSGIFTLFWGVRPSPAVGRWVVAVWDTLVFACLYLRLTMEFGNVLGDGEDAKEAPVVYDLDLIRALN